MDDNNHDHEEMTDHPRWPYTELRLQAHFEKNFMEEGATIHFDKLKPMPAWASLFLMTDKVRVGFILLEVASSSKILDRRLTASEVESLSEHETTFMHNMAYAGPCSVLAGAAVAWRGRAIFRFPFYKPTFKRLDPQAFPTRRSAILRGPPARAAWHFARLGVYTAVLSPLVLLFCRSSFATSKAVAKQADPRLARLNKEFKDIVSQHKLQNSRPDRVARQQGNMQSPAQHPSNPARDGGSSTDGNDAARFGDGPDGESYPREPTAERLQPSPGWNLQTRINSPRPVNDRGAPDSGDGVDPFGDDIDDASPVAPASSSFGNGRSSASQNNSAWDKLRRQAGSDSNSPDPGRGQSRSQWQDGWGDRESTQGRQEKPDAETEREREQRDFDALLEAERRGGFEERGIPRR